MSQASICEESRALPRTSPGAAATTATRQPASISRRFVCRPPMCPCHHVMAGGGAAEHGRWWCSAAASSSSRPEGVVCLSISVLRIKVRHSSMVAPSCRTGHDGTFPWRCLGPHDSVMVARHPGSVRRLRSSRRVFHRQALMPRAKPSCLSQVVALVVALQLSKGIVRNCVERQRMETRINAAGTGLSRGRHGKPSACRMAQSGLARSGPFLPWFQPAARW